MVMLYLMAAFVMKAGALPGDWTGNYPPCNRHMEVLKHEPMHLGVRFSTSNRELAAEFARAMNFWATILDMDWRQEDSGACAIQIVDGQPRLFKPGEVARAQFPGRPSFQGWIAFNPRVSLAANELFLAAVHELGHTLGLLHSTNAFSVMYFLNLDGPVFLDDADLAALAISHQLRGVERWPSCYQCVSMSHRQHRPLAYRAVPFSPYPTDNSRITLLRPLRSYLPAESCNWLPVAP
ncbi:MAG: matrixin family metalloprotease [Acetobacteraceae bacterium]|nr:matrixin family metalloprotease [Acetobacteraceae bacterium]